MIKLDSCLRYMVEQNCFRVEDGTELFQSCSENEVRNSELKFKQISFGYQSKFPGGKSYSTIKQIALGDGRLTYDKNI